MNNLPMIENEWKDCVVQEFRIISDQLTRSYHTKIYSPVGVLAMELIESAFQGATNGKLTHERFVRATFYASYLSKIPRDVLCIYLAEKLLARGHSRIVSRGGR